MALWRLSEKPTATNVISEQNHNLQSLPAHQGEKFIKNIQCRAASAKTCIWMQKDKTNGAVSTDLGLLTISIYHIAGPLERQSERHEE